MIAFLLRIPFRSPFGFKKENSIEKILILGTMALLCKGRLCREQENPY
jgi:hypothetical protein